MGLYRVFNIFAANACTTFSFSVIEALKRRLSVGLVGMKPTSPEQLKSLLLKWGRPLASFKKGDTIKGTETMSKPYSYILTEEPGELGPDFQPALSPAEILLLGAFEGSYLNDCYREFPAEWFLGALMTDSLRPGAPDETVNLFKIKSRQPLSAWRENGWVHTSRRVGKTHRAILSSPENPDERGWFQWYCRYWMGRRIPDLDHVQIGRWRSFARHAGAIKANCKPGDLSCRPRERQALLQWAWNPFI
jgi:hypothetical protein